MHPRTDTPAPGQPSPDWMRPSPGQEREHPLNGSKVSGSSLFNAEIDLINDGFEKAYANYGTDRIRFYMAGYSFYEDIEDVLPEVCPELYYVANPEKAPNPEQGCYTTDRVAHSCPSKFGGSSGVLNQAVDACLNSTDERARRIANPEAINFYIYDATSFGSKADNYHIHTQDGLDHESHGSSNDGAPYVFVEFTRFFSVFRNGYGQCTTGPCGCGSAPCWSPGWTSWDSSNWQGIHDINYDGVADTTLEGININNVEVHELGHVFGLNHLQDNPSNPPLTSEPYNVMAGHWPWTVFDTSTQHYAPTSCAWTSTSDRDWDCSAGNIRNQRLGIRLRAWILEQAWTCH